MRKLVSILLFAVFATECANSVSLRRRREAAAEDEQDTGVIAIMQNGMGMVKSLPVVGRPIGSGETWISDTYNKLQDLTNGAFARVLGGALPCEMSTENGIRCAGITNETSIASLIVGIAAESPLPDMGLTLMRATLDGTLDPIMNIMFGGVPSSGSQ